MVRRFAVASSSSGGLLSTSKVKLSPRRCRHCRRFPPHRPGTVDGHDIALQIRVGLRCRPSKDGIPPTLAEAQSFLAPVMSRSLIAREPGNRSTENLKVERESRSPACEGGLLFFASCQDRHRRLLPAPLRPIPPTSPPRPPSSPPGNTSARTPVAGRRTRHATAKEMRFRTGSSCVLGVGRLPTRPGKGLTTLNPPPGRSATSQKEVTKKPQNVYSWPPHPTTSGVQSLIQRWNLPPTGPHPAVSCRRAPPPPPPTATSTGWSAPRPARSSPGGRARRTSHP